MRHALILLVFVFSVFGAASVLPPFNTELFFEDSLYVDGTAAKFSKVFWMDNGLYKCFLVEARDSANYATSGGWAACTSAVKVELYQGFPVTNEYGSVKSNRITGYNKYIAAIPSHAHPDSTSMHPLNFVVFDSLSICMMDTSAVYLRNAVVDTALTGNQIGTHYGDSLKTVQTSGFGAFEYTCLPPDASPAGAFKFTGLSVNSSAGRGSFWRIRGYQYKAFPTK